MTVGDRIRYYRLNSRMSQHDLAVRLGVATQTIFKYEKGIIDISLAAIAKIADVFEIDPALLCGWERPAGPTRIEKALDALNDAGKERVAEYAEDLVASGRYSKSAGAAIADRA